MNAGSQMWYKNEYDYNNTFLWSFIHKLYQYNIKLYNANIILSYIMHNIVNKKLNS